MCKVSELDRGIVISEMHSFMQSGRQKPEKVKTGEYWKYRHNCKLSYVCMQERERELHITLVQV